MRAVIDLQQIASNANTPTAEQYQLWVDAVFAHQHLNAELTIRLVDIAEMTALNQQYRNKQGPTNVLSFPFEGELEPGSLALVGDIIICCQVVEREAEEQRKDLIAHYAHIVIHGVLHLLGYDHEQDMDAREMERLEIELLRQLNYDNPYAAGCLK